MELNWAGGHLELLSDATINTDQYPPVMDALQQLVDEWHITFVWFVAIATHRESIQESFLIRLSNLDKPITVAVVHPDGSRQDSPTMITGRMAMASFSDDGFENLYAKSLVTSMYGFWETPTRTEIAEAFHVDPHAVQSDFLNDLRLLRNWLIHPTADAERQYFRSAIQLPALLRSQPGKPEITFDGILILMHELNDLTIRVVTK